MLHSLGRRRNQKKGISPIIATLLLILITIAAGVIVYDYVINFIGNSTQNPGVTQNVIQIEEFCASGTVAVTSCNASTDAYYIVVLNHGPGTIPAGSLVNIYFTDVTTQVSANANCTVGATLPQNTYSCASASWPTGFSVGAHDSVSVKVVDPDGGSATSSSIALA